MASNFCLNECSELQGKEIAINLDPLFFIRKLDVSVIER